jgi:hypothetical protein
MSDAELSTPRSERLTLKNGGVRAVPKIERGPHMSRLLVAFGIIAAAIAVTLVLLWTGHAQLAIVAGFACLFANHVVIWPTRTWRRGRHRNA